MWCKGVWVDEKNVYSNAHEYFSKVVKLLLNLKTMENKKNDMWHSELADGVILA